MAILRLRDMGFVQKFRADLLPLRATLVRTMIWLKFDIVQSIFVINSQQPPKKSRSDGLEPLQFEFIWTPLFCVFVGFTMAAAVFLAEKFKSEKKQEEDKEEETKGEDIPDNPF